MAYDLFPEVEMEAMSRARMNPGIGDPSFGAGFFKGVGMYAVRGFAETARAVDLLGAVPPVLIDKLTGSHERSDQYFSEHDEVFGSAVDYWTPRPGEVGAAGQIVGSLAGALPQIIISPELAVATATLSPAEDLTKAGVEVPTAIGVGMIQGAALAAGMRLPYLGNTLTSRMASGAIGNLAVSMTSVGISHTILKATGHAGEAETFNPFDLTQRSVDVLMGIAFGGLAHLDAKTAAAYRAALDEDAKAAILVLNQANQTEAVARSQGSQLPEHLNRKVNAIQQAVEQALKGDAVTVDRDATQLFRGTPDSTKAWQGDVHGEAAKAARDVMGEPIQPILKTSAVEHEPVPGRAAPDEGRPVVAPTEAQVDPMIETARSIANDRPDLLLPTGELDADGRVKTMPVADFLAKAQELATAKTADAGIFRAALTCLLGAA